jgi:hypothetical protein
MLVKNHTARQSPPPTATSSTTAHAWRPSSAARRERYMPQSCCNSEAGFRILSSAARGASPDFNPCRRGRFRSGSSGGPAALDRVPAQVDVLEHAIVERQEQLPGDVARQAGHATRQRAQAAWRDGPAGPRSLGSDGRREHGSSSLVPLVARPAWRRRVGSQGSGWSTSRFPAVTAVTRPRRELSARRRGFPMAGSRLGIRSRVPVEEPRARSEPRPARFVN